MLEIMATPFSVIQRDGIKASEGLTLYNFMISETSLCSAAASEIASGNRDFRNSTCIEIDIGVGVGDAKKRRVRLIEGMDGENQI